MAAALRPFEPLRSRLLRLRPDEPAWFDVCTHLAAQRGLCTASGLPLVFRPMPAGSAPLSALDYERVILGTGVVPCRTGPGALHDLHNALAWLRWPQTKAQINRLHVLAAERAPLDEDDRPAGRSGVPGRGRSRGRGRWRDRLSLIDESGVVWFEPSPAGPATNALRAHRWRELFVTHRERWPNEAGTPDRERDGRHCGHSTPRLHVAVIGHGLLEKCARPYKALTAHAWQLPPPSALAADDWRAHGPAGGAVDPLDRHAASLLRRIDVAILRSCRADEVLRLGPLPLAGIPGWFPGNDAPGFVDDRTVFRPLRRAPSAGDRVG